MLSLRFSIFGRILGKIHAMTFGVLAIVQASQNQRKIAPEAKIHQKIRQKSDK